MAQDDITKCLGLVTQYNPLNVSPGALITADDAIIRRENVIENRRGYYSYGTTSGTPTQLMSYLNTVLVANGSASVAYDNGSGTFTDYSGSTYAPPSGAKMHYQEAINNLYVTTTSGVQVFMDVAGTAARLAGAPRSLDPSYAMAAAGSGFLAASSQCAYRCCFQRTDQNKNVFLGYPSSRLWVVNTGGTSDNVVLTVYLPSEAVSGDVLQFYRTAQIAGTSTDSSGDEMGLVYQATLTAGDITAGFITVTDVVVDALRGATLYTSPSQEGINQANDRPPLAKDLALFNDYMFYANTQTKQRLFVTLIGWSGLYNGGAYGKSITLNGVTYTFAAAEDAATGQIQVFNAGSDAANIDNTARSLVRVINRYATNTGVYAFYLSGPDDLPGKILLEGRTLSTAAFGLSASDTTAAGAFFPAPPTSAPTSGASYSSNSIQKNALFYSKAQQPEAVPLLNYQLVGAANTEILRVVALRDSLIIIKEEGVFRLTGDTPTSFIVDALDRTTFCKAEESVALLSNQVYMVSNQGVVAISDTGVRVVSREIEPSLLPLLSFSSLNTYTFGAAYESERLYLLSTMSTSSDTAPTQTYVYNIFTKCWTRWTFGFTSAVIEPDTDKIYFTKAGVTNVYRERKDFSTDDYADPEQAITISSISGSTVEFTQSATTSPKVGDVILIGTTGIPILSLVQLNPSGWQAVVADTPPSSWVAGAGTLYPGIRMVVVYDNWVGGTAGAMKQVREMKLLVDNINANTTITFVYATFYTDLDTAQETILIPSVATGWGSEWGDFGWGGESDAFDYRTFVPRNKQYCRILNPGFIHQNAKEKISVSGISLTYNVISERTNK